MINRELLLGPDPEPSEYLEAFRALRASLFARELPGQGKAVLIASATGEEGRTTIAVNLATVLARSEKRTLLVDADFAKPEVHQVYGLTSAPGLTDLLLGQTELEQAIRRNDLEYLHVMPVGSRPQEGADLMGSARAAEVLEQVRQQYDFCLFDSAPVEAFAGAVQVAAMVDDVLMVVRSRSSAAAVQRALRMLRATGAVVQGVVLNDVMAVDREVMIELPQEDLEE